jgi:capsule polysaccharide modification protein KpsS
LSFVRSIADWAKASKQNVVFKLHPGLFPTCEVDNEVIRAANEYAATSGHAFCSQANVHDLISNAKGVFTINSGVGFESLIHGKPVVTFGNSDYQWVTFRANPNCLDAARAFVFEYTDESRQEAYKFVYYYLFRHGFNLDAEYLADAQYRLSNYLARAIGS